MADRVAAEHHLLQTNQRLLRQIEAYEKALSDTDCLALQLANLYQAAVRRLGHKLEILKWPNVRLSAGRVVARSEGKYNGVDADDYTGIFTGEGDHE